MHELVIVSLMAPNVLPAHRAIVAWLATVVGIPARLVAGPTWQAQLQMLDSGAAQAAFICGLPTTRRAAWLEPLAAPVQVGARYEGRPCYYSDIVVPADSPYQRLADLRGARWAFNEPGSFSGYVVALAHLAELGAHAGFFGQAIETGGHLASLRMVAAGQADAAAIDSSVLELALRDEPTLAGRVRSIVALGPNPAPPFAVARALPAVERDRLRAALAAMHADSAGRAALAAGLIERFAPVTDADYDPIRLVALQAEGVALTPSPSP